MGSAIFGPDLTKNLLINAHILMYAALSQQIFRQIGTQTWHSSKIQDHTLNRQWRQLKSLNPNCGVDITKDKLCKIK